MQNTQTHHSPAPNLWHSVFSAWISIKEQKKLITPVLTSHSHLERHDRSKNMRLLSGWGRCSQARSVKRRLSSSSCLFLVFIIAHLTESQKLRFGLLMYLLVNIMAPPSAMIEAIHYNCAPIFNSDVYLEGGWVARVENISDSEDGRRQSKWSMGAGEGSENCSADASDAQDVKLEAAARD